MYERIFDISKMVAKIDIMIFCNIANHSSMTTSNKGLVELSILKKRTKSAQARKAVAQDIYLVSFWHQRACKILAGLE